MTAFYTTAQLAELLAVHPNSIKRMTDDGRLPRPVKLSAGRSGAVRYPAAETLAAIEAMRS